MERPDKGKEEAMTESAYETRQKVLLVQETVEKIRPLLRGLGAHIQGAVLADLTSMWLAGFQGGGDGIKQLREDMLKMHVDMIRNLVPINEMIILGGVFNDRAAGGADADDKESAAGSAASQSGGKANQTEDTRK